jgi:hypothetical protein
MLLSKLLPELTQVGIGIVGTWEINAKKGITLGDPKRSFPNPVGERYQVDCTRAPDPDLTDYEVRTIRRRFGIAET